MHEAYRFRSTGAHPVEGFVFKAGKVWEARIDRTNITVRGESRRHAVELAVSQAAGLAISQADEATRD